MPPPLCCPAMSHGGTGWCSKRRVGRAVRAQEAAVAKPLRGQGCFRRAGASEVAPEAVGWAVWRRLRKRFGAGESYSSRRAVAPAPPPRLRWDRGPLEWASVTPRTCASVRGCSGGGCGRAPPALGRPLPVGGRRCLPAGLCSPGPASTRTAGGGGGGAQ